MIVPPPLFYYHCSTIKFPLSLFHHYCFTISARLMVSCITAPPNLFHLFIITVPSLLFDQLCSTVSPLLFYLYFSPHFCNLSVPLSVLPSLFHHYRCTITVSPLRFHHYFSTITVPPTCSTVPPRNPKKKFKKSKNWEFLKRVSPCFLQNIPNFSIFLFLVKRGLFLKEESIFRP